MEKKITSVCVVCKQSNMRLLFAHRGGDMGQCLTCGLVQMTPMLSASEIALLYEDDFDHFTPYIAQLAVHRIYFHQKVMEIKQYFSRVTNKTLLDIGCAMGVLLSEAKKQKMKATGIDISADAAKYCKQQGLDVRAGTIQQLKGKWKKSSFDVVTAFQIIEHERDPLDFVMRVHKLLKNNGLVVLATPNYDGLWRRIMGKRWVGFTHPEHVALFGSTSMRFLLEKAGFKDITILRDSLRPFPLSFAIARAADYFPFFSWVLRPMSRLVDQFKITNPLNPWDDMIVFARK